MGRNLFILAFLLCTFSLMGSRTVQAKTLPQAQSGQKASTVRVGSTSGIAVYPKFRSDRQALLVTFANLQNANSVMYSLSYKTNGQEEGVGGTITPTDTTTSRELLFGTCSKNVCRYHPNITNARFEVQASLKNGKTSIKRYKIRV